MNSIIMNYIYFVLFNILFSMNILIAADEDGDRLSKLSFYFKYRDGIGDFSYRNIVERKVHEDQQSIDSVITRLGQINRDHSDKLYKLDFSSSHIVSPSFEKIIDFLLLEENRGLFANLKFLNFSSNLNIVISRDHLEKLISLFNFSPGIYVDLTNTFNGNAELIKELSNPLIIWIPENWFKRKFEGEQPYIVIKKQYRSLTGEMDQPFLLSHQVYFQSKKLGELYWIKTPFESFNKDTRICDIGDIGRLTQEIRSDLVSMSSSFSKHIEELHSNDFNSLLIIGKAYLEQKRLKYNPIKSFLLLKYIVDTCNGLENYTEEIADAYWLLSTFYRDGFVVAQNFEIAQNLSRNEIKKAQSYLLRYRYKAWIGLRWPYQNKR